MSDHAMNEVESTVQEGKSASEHAGNLSRENQLSSVGASDRIKMFLTPGSCVALGNLTICDSNTGGKAGSATIFGTLENLPQENLPGKGLRQK